MRLVFSGPRSLQAATGKVQSWNKQFQRANMSPEGLRDISGEQWLFGSFSAADSSYSAIQEMVNVRRGSESGNNQFNSFLQGEVVEFLKGWYSRWKWKPLIYCCLLGFLTKPRPFHPEKKDWQNQVFSQWFPAGLQLWTMSFYSLVLWKQLLLQDASRAVIVNLSLSSFQTFSCWVLTVSRHFTLDWEEELRRISGASHSYICVFKYIPQVNFRIMSGLQCSSDNNHVAMIKLYNL